MDFCFRMQPVDFATLLILLTVPFSLVRVDAFLIDDCGSQHTCQCSGQNIRCDNLQLPKIPALTLSRLYSMVYLHLQV